MMKFKRIKITKNKSIEFTFMTRAIEWFEISLKPGSTYYSNSIHFRFAFLKLFYTGIVYFEVKNEQN